MTAAPQIIYTIN